MHFRFTSLAAMLIIILCSVVPAHAKKLTVKNDRIDLLQEVTINTFDELKENHQLEKLISQKYPELLPNLSSSIWQKGSFTIDSEIDSFWVEIGNRGMWEDLTVIAIEKSSNKIQIFHDIDIFRNSEDFLRAHWINFTDSHIERSYDIYVSLKLKHEQLPLRKFIVMTNLAKHQEYLFAKPIIYAFFTCLLMLFLYNIMLSWRLRSWIHAVYAIYCLSIMFFIGLGFSSFYTEALYTYFELSLRDIYLMSGVCLEGVLLLFCYVFLEPKYRTGKIWLFLYTLLLISALVTLYTIYAPYNFTLSPNINILNKIYGVIALIFLLALPTAFAVSWRRGSKNGFFLFFSQLPPFLVLIIHVIAGLFDIRSSTWFTFRPFAFPAAYLLEILVLSYAMTEQVRRIRDASLNDKIEAERKITLLLENQNAKLEQLVTERTHELMEAKCKSDKLARTDSLTGMNNRHGFFEYGALVYERSKRSCNFYSILIMDIDHFKKVNDTFGHAAGDYVIRSVAEIIKKSTRACDILGRIGGEEFAVIQPKLAQDEAVDIATLICNEVAKAIFKFEQVELSLSISIGVAQAYDIDHNIDEVLSRADVALYHAKSLGRNRVCSDCAES